jgi:RHS repeat-associated protein
LGSPICVTDIDGSVVWKGDYLPFGEPLQDIDTVYWGNAYTYLGNEDDGGLMYFHARYYAKELGRFMSCDPIKDMASSALTINPYIYCGNNPIVFKDPLGLRQAPGPSWGDEESGGGGGGTNRGFWEGQGFDTWGGGNPFIIGCVIHSAAGPDISNSFVQILLFAVSRGGIANDLKLVLEDEGYSVDIEGYSVTSEEGQKANSNDPREGSMRQRMFHNALTNNSNKYDLLGVLCQDMGNTLLSGDR